jgi:hypothetical protein
VKGEAGTPVTALSLPGRRAGLEREAVSPNTVAKAYRLLARIMDTAVEAGILVRNPAQ